MKKYSLLLIQIFIVVFCFPIFFFLGKIFNPLDSFVFSFLSYWILLFITSLILVIKDFQLSSNLKKYFTQSKSILISLVSFVPVLAVFFVAFLPIIKNLNLSIFIIVLLISLFNGFFEEIFWRGLVLSKYSDSNLFLIISTIMFSIYHFAFLFLPIEYQGGSANLVGGAAFMGFIWIYVSKKTENIVYSIIAHQLVNFFAFSGLFILNNLQ